MTTIKDLRIYEILSCLRKRKYVYMKKDAVVHIGLKTYFRPYEELICGR